MCVFCLVLFLIQGKDFCISKQFRNYVIFCHFINFFKCTSLYVRKIGMMLLTRMMLNYPVPISTRAIQLKNFLSILRFPPSYLFLPHTFLFIFHPLFCMENIFGLIKNVEFRNFRLLATWLLCFRMILFFPFLHNRPNPTYTLPHLQIATLSQEQALELSICCKDSLLLS